MRHGIVPVVAGATILLVAGCGPPPPGPRPPSPVTTTTPVPEPDESGIRADGLPGLRLDRDRQNLTVGDIESVLAARGEGRLMSQTEFCGLAVYREWQVAATMTADQGLTSFLVEREDVPTAEGIFVGRSSTQDVVRAYGADHVHRYPAGPTRGGRTILWVDDPEHLGQRPQADVTLHLAFEVGNDGMVERIRSGFWPYVTYLDLCSDDAEQTSRIGGPDSVGWPLVG